MRRSYRLTMPNLKAGVADRKFLQVRGTENDTRRRQSSTLRSPTVVASHEGVGQPAGRRFITPTFFTHWTNCTR